MQILTLNLQNYQEQVATWEVRLGRLCRLVSQLEPDVVLLQAVRQDPKIDPRHQAEQLQQKLGLFPYCHWEEATINPDGTADGSAILARQPFAGVPETLLLEDDPDGVDPAGRLVIATRCALPGGSLHLLNAHLSYSATAFARNIDELLPFVADFEGPCLLAGDFNATPDAAPLASLREAGWVDLWQHFHPDDPGYTFQSFAPRLRIDYVWANGAALPLVQKLERVADAEPEHLLSDHCGLLVTLG